MCILIFCGPKLIMKPRFFLSSNLFFSYSAKTVHSFLFVGLQKVCIFCSHRRLHTNLTEAPLVLLICGVVIIIIQKTIYSLWLIMCDCWRAQTFIYANMFLYLCLYSLILLTVIYYCVFIYIGHWYRRASENSFRGRVLSDNTMWEKVIHLCDLDLGPSPNI